MIEAAARPLPPRPTKRVWADMTEADIGALDLAAFLDGPNPYPASDNSLQRAYALGKSFYADAVRQRVGFRGGRVLDMLSGFGRWLPFLAETHDDVVGVERMPESNELAANFCRHFGFNNVTLMTGDIERIGELGDASFDHIWCWSGLQYVAREYALKQSHRLLKPGGRIFIGAYNASGLMLEHLLNGAEAGVVHEGSAKWALSALARGSQRDGNPNYMDIEGLDEMCERFGFHLIAAAPQDYLDIREPDGRRAGWRDAPRVKAYLRTIEFLAEKPAS